MEIMDVEDELDTVKRVLLQQGDALNSFAKLLFADYQQSRDRRKKKSAKSREPRNDASWSSGSDSDYPTSQRRKKKRKRSVTFLQQDSEDEPAIGHRVHVPFADDQDRSETTPSDGSWDREKTWNLAKANLDVVRSNVAKINEIAGHAQRIRGEVCSFCSLSSFRAISAE